MGTDLMRLRFGLDLIGDYRLLVSLESFDGGIIIRLQDPSVISRKDHKTITEDYNWKWLEEEQGYYFPF